MPCRDNGAYADDCAELQKRCDNLTKLLCWACKRLLDKGVILPTDAHKWYNEHMKLDKERIKQEALAKLTSEEKRF